MISGPQKGKFVAFPISSRAERIRTVLNPVTIVTAALILAVLTVPTVPADRDTANTVRDNVQKFWRL
ncbi:MAG: hypothetical protein EZS28_016308 [Streblomastix strix]|uniref:Uncharacterized protein n=1 Tax=Streblomastix strix TaxID=222440 RepID=A0A5J4VZQ8_9EUKA|nr:MAG: hypothetical protein EZS28_016308 [Streblomastix strix]